MSVVANKLLEGVNWFDMPWSVESLEALHDRLLGQIDCVPQECRFNIILPMEDDLTIGSVNDEIRGAAATLSIALDWSNSPEGPTFWQAVHTVLLDMERNLDREHLS